MPVLELELAYFNQQYLSLQQQYVAVLNIKIVCPFLWDMDGLYSATSYLRRFCSQQQQQLYLTATAALNTARATVPTHQLPLSQQQSA